MNAGTDTALHTITSHVRGGGSGGSAWVAKITGLHPDYVFEREFVRSEDALSRSGRSGQIHFPIAEPGVYEYRGVQYEAGEATIGELDRGFLRVTRDGVEEIRKDEVIEDIRGAT